MARETCSNPECGVALRVGEFTGGRCFDCQYVAMMERSQDRINSRSGPVGVQP